MTRLKIHHMLEGGASQASVAEKCGVGLRSVQRVLTEEAPSPAEVATGQREQAPRRGRPPKADETLRERIRLILKEEPDMLATEVFRRARGWGYAGSRSAMSALVKQLRPLPSKEPVVRFDGLPGEYAQFDFGEAWVRYLDGTREKILFFAGRLKYSRMRHVVLVENQQSETVARSLIACLMAFGGSPKEWVFDNPRTIRLSPWGAQPVLLHPYLRDLVAEYRVIPTFCAPRSGNQKGSVERLVGFTKRSFLFARPFADRADLEAQLAQWLHEINHVRPCDATGVTPAVALEDERPWLSQRPVRVSDQAHALREPAVVSPMGTVTWKGTAYFASARLIGASATLFIRRHEVEVVVGDGAERCVHRRRDGVGVVQRLPGQSDAVLAVLRGRRKQATFKRQCLLELGPEAFRFLGGLVHRCPDGSWEVPCTELYDLLQRHGGTALSQAFARCYREDHYTVEAVASALKEAA